MSSASCGRSVNRSQITASRYAASVAQSTRALSHAWRFDTSCAATRFLRRLSHRPSSFPRRNIAASPPRSDQRSRLFPATRLLRKTPHTTLEMIHSSRLNFEPETAKIRQRFRQFAGREKRFTALVSNSRPSSFLEEQFLCGAHSVRFFALLFSQRSYSSSVQRSRLFKRKTI